MEFVSQYGQTLVIAAIFLLALFVIVGVWRAFSPRMSGRRGQRISLSEYYELDKTRRLVLIRRDNVEHLILIGGGQDIVIESNIPSGSAAPSYAPPPVHAEQPAAGTARPAPRPPAFSERKAPPPLRPVADAPAPLRPREEPEL